MESIISSVGPCENLYSGEFKILSRRNTVLKSSKYHIIIKIALFFQNLERIAHSVIFIILTSITTKAGCFVLSAKKILLLF